MNKQYQILVCIDTHPKSNVLLRAAANKSKETGVPWGVLYVETPQHFTLDRDARERVLRFLTVAEEMGGNVHSVEHRDVIGGIKNYVETANDEGKPVQTLIMGQSSKEGFFDELKASLAERMMREVRRFSTEVQIVPLVGKQYISSWFDRLQLRDIKLREIVFALISVVLAYLGSEILRMQTSDIGIKNQVYNVTAFFLVAAIITSLRYGLVPGLVSAVAGFSTINYFYVAPYGGFGISHSGDAVNLSVFLVSAVIISLMGGYNRAWNSSLSRKEKRSQALYKVHRLASDATDREGALAILHEELSRLLEMDIAFFLPPAVSPDTLELVYPGQTDFTSQDEKSLQLCWDEVRTTGHGTANKFDSIWRFEPLTTHNGEIGVIAIKVPLHVRLDASFGRLLSALADQAASILERIELTKMMSESRMREEREKLRAMLLSSVSHDLKTPLASIIGSLSVHNRMKKAGRLDSDTSDELIDTALDEAQRLDSFISNILDMTRIESGEITFDTDWVDVEKPLLSIKKRMRQRLANHELVVHLFDVPCEVKMDRMMTEQVLQNVIDNAVKYSPKGTQVSVTLSEEEGGFSYKVKDQGAGIPDGKFEAVFDKYERLKQSDSQVAGTGLGLAISKAVMEKQGGEITARNHEAGGAEFILWFPHMRKNMGAKQGAYDKERKQVV
ncbi:ATP-binding protein [Kiloniella majae]|uniref:ATP-binding protein n=1 Tax=Kiloniella majae TaxID=1938558 RepID=UPI000A277459|nr:ATP-binding protein [Kiloniella majae]